MERNVNSMKGRTKSVGILRRGLVTVTLATSYEFNDVTK